MYSDIALVRSLGGVGESEVLTVLIEAADEHINSETQDDFSGLQEEAAKVFDGSGAPTILVSPKLSVPTKLEYLISYDENTWREYNLKSGIFTFGKGWVIVDSGWKQPYRSWSVREKGRSVFSKGLQNIRVTGNWGWSAVPARIKLASATLAAQVSKKVSSDLSSERLGDYSYNKHFVELVKSVESMSIQGIIDEFRLHKIIGSVI